MADLQELYQSIILDHNRRPKNYGALEGATSRAEGRNPLCGDEVAIELKVEGDTIADVRFTAAGCAVHHDAGGEGKDTRRGGAAVRAVPRPRVRQAFALSHRGTSDGRDGRLQR